MLNYVCRSYVSDVIFRKIVYLENSPVDCISSHSYFYQLSVPSFFSFVLIVEFPTGAWEFFFFFFSVQQHMQSFLSIHRGLVPGPIVNVRIRGYSSRVISTPYLWVMHPQVWRADCIAPSKAMAILCQIHTCHF